MEERFFYHEDEVKEYGVRKFLVGVVAGLPIGMVLMVAFALLMNYLGLLE